MPELSDDLARSSLRQRWRDRVTWGALLTVGWIVYEITAKPGFGIAIACAKFGWKDFVTAIWMLRRDSRRGRGQACFYFFLASGLWKVTIAAVVLTGGVMILSVLCRVPIPKQLISLAVTALAGVTLLAVIPVLGAIIAHAHQVRIWIDPAAHRSRADNQWPPASSDLNLVPGLLFPALLLPVVVTAVMTLTLGPWIMLLSVMGEGLFIWALFRGITARHPHECWDDFEEPARDYEEAVLESDELAEVLQ